MSDWIETAAAAVHQAYLDTSERLGWPVKPSSAVPYDELSEDAKELDRASARAVLAAVWDDLPANVTGRCPEHHLTFCESCGWVNPQAAKVALAAAQPTVDRWDLRQVLRNADPDWATDDHWMAVADALLASGVLTDAATVRAAARREVAEEIAAAIEVDRNEDWQRHLANHARAYGSEATLTSCPRCYATHDALAAAARIARDAAARPAAHGDGRTGGRP